MLTTVLLGGVGVSDAWSVFGPRKLTDTDHCVHSGLHSTRYPPLALHWPRWHRRHLPCHRSAMALFQQKPRGMATTAQLFSGNQDRGGRPESRLGWANQERKKCMHHIESKYKKIKIKTWPNGRII